MIKQYLYIKTIAGKGRGVFTKEKITANILVEEAPVIVMSAAERPLLDKTLLHDYIFEWGEDKSQCCMALGFVPVYNHSYVSNCEYFMDFEEQMIRIKTVRKIKAGEELTINYNGDWNNKKRVWFEVKE
ncbi:MAG TPA: SET domain-containing protein [Hanamia sp.]|nr:SET domain-containing protein [Hanamia sp.]